MANEALTIWNRALAVVAAPRISSVTEVSFSKELIDDHWVGIRKEFAGMQPWDGLLNVVSLVENVSVTIDRWNKAWDLPADFEQAWRVNDLASQDGPQPHWEIIAVSATPAKYLFTDTTPAKLEYSADPDTDPKLAELNGRTTSALVRRLALELARPWGKKEQDIAVLAREYERALLDARWASSKQQKKKFGRERPLVDARFHRRFGTRI